MWNCWNLEERTRKWQRSPASRERADIKIIPHPHQNCPITAAKVMTFLRWDGGRLCGFLKLAFPRSLKRFQQEPADHTKRVFHLKMFQIQGFWRLITPHHHPDIDSDVLPWNRMSPAGPNNYYRMVSSALDKSIEDIVWAVLSRFNCVGLFATLWLLCQDPLSMGILQVKILEWVVMPSSRGSSPSRDRITHVPCGSCFAGRFFTTEPLGKPIVVLWLW